MSQNRVTDAQIAAAIRSSGAIMHTMATKLGMNRVSVWKRITKSPTLQRVVEETRESVLDLAESSLISAITQQAPWATCFYLKCKGKSRGYVERQEVTGADGGPVKTRECHLSDEELRKIIDGK